MKQQLIQQKRYQKIQIIGNGTFGCVYLAKDLLNNQKKFAVKHVRENKKYKNRQLQIMKSLNHSNIVQFYDYFYEDLDKHTYLNLIMEYMPETLASIIKNNMLSKTFIDNQQVVKYSYGLLQALEYLETKNIVHRDIKPSNILINQNGNAKLCDFGSAKLLIPGMKNVSYICSRYYRSPELIFGATEYTTSIDVWSLGCCIAEMLIAKPLFDGSNNNNLLLRIIKTIGSPTLEDLESMKVEKKIVQKFQGTGLKQRILKINSKSQQAIIDLIQKMLVYNPEKRIRPEEALKLPLFKVLNLETKLNSTKL